MNHPEFQAWREWLEGLPMGIPTTQGDGILTPNASPVAMIQGQLQMDKMIGPFAKPMLVDGLRFRAEVGGLGFYSSGNDLALSFQVRVNAGPFALTNDFVAVAALATREQYNGGEIVNVDLTGLNVVPSGLFQITRTDGGRGAQYTWYFQEPLYLPAGVPLRVNLKRFYNDTRDGNAVVGSLPAVNTDCALFGRYFPAGVASPPGAVPVPYAATYTDPTVPGPTNPIVSQVTSAETDLCNQTSGVLYLDRMTGRLPARSLAGGTVPSICGEYNGPEPLIRIVRTYSAGRDAFARANNRAYIDPGRPFNSVFDQQTRALGLAGVEMPPGSAFIASILKQTSQVGLMANLRIFPVLGLLGTRMESWGA